LWVVCRHCERWNLSPLEARWEAIEACEETYAGTVQRVASDNIGLAKLKEGLELVRIGAPLRPEFAAWRYGDQFGRRRRRTLLIGGSLLMGVGVVVAGASVAGISLVTFSGMLGNIPNFFKGAQTVRVRTPEGRVLKVGAADFNKATFSADPSTHEPEFSFKRKGRLHVYRGVEAMQMATRLIPAINGAGGSKRSVGDAVREIEERRGSEAYLDDVLREKVVPLRKQAFGKTNRKSVAELPTPTRLAIEMALHEEAERRAIEGELVLLETAWREAEEIANIADNLLVPTSVEEQLSEIRRAAAE
jgi:hypothetical protein